MFLILIGHLLVPISEKRANRDENSYESPFSETGIYTIQDHLRLKYLFCQIGTYYGANWDIHINNFRLHPDYT